jgi:hypothetical protein
MRSSIRFILAVLTAAAFSPFLQAQFQQPTSEELAMTADPKAPGAAAVYLYREEKTDDQASLKSFYERIKVLTEKGRDLATVSIPYEYGKFQIAGIQGRTIHADGTIIPLKAKPSDLLDVKNSGHQYKRMVFTLPSAEVGSILEYRLMIHYGENEVSAPHWIIQQPYFVHKAHYVFDPAYNSDVIVKNSRGEPMEGLMASTRLGPTGQIERDSHNRFTLDLTDIPALPDEDWMPPLNTYQSRVIFYYTYANSGDEYWAREGSHWASDVNHLAAPSGPVKQAASGIVSAGDSDEIKAHKLYAAVMKMQNRDFVGNSEAGYGGGIRDAAGVLKAGGGSSDEIALLYIALARAAGLKAWPMQVVNRDRATFDSTYLFMDQLDDFIAVVQIDGKDVYLDPGQKMCPFGILHWKHELATGFRLTDKDAAIETTPAGTPKSADVQRVADLSIDEQGAVQGTARLLLSGQEALYWRQIAQTGQSEVGKRFTEWLRESLPDGVSVDFSGFDGLDNYETNLVATATLSGTIGSGTGKRLILPGVFFESRGHRPFVAQEIRTTPIDLHYAVMEEDNVTYRLPRGVGVDSTPSATNISWGDHALLQIRTAAKDGSIQVTRNLVRNSTVLDAGYYPMLRNFYLKMSDADQQQIVLSRSTTEKAN